MGAEDRVNLEKDLRWAAERPLRNFYKQAGGKDEHDYYILARIVKAIVGEQRWRSRPNQSLIDVVSDLLVVHEASPRSVQARVQSFCCQAEGRSSTLGTPWRSTTT